MKPAACRVKTQNTRLALTLIELLETLYPAQGGYHSGRFDLWPWSPDDQRFLVTKQRGETSPNDGSRFEPLNRGDLAGKTSKKSLPSDGRGPGCTAIELDVTS